MATLVATHSEVIAGSAIQCILETLEDPELLRVTRDEYFTYLTPEGELYDKSAVPGLVVTIDQLMITTERNPLDVMISSSMYERVELFIILCCHF